MTVVEQLTVFLLLLALAGCERAKPPEHRATPASSPQVVKLIETSPSQPVTTQSIVKDMFPNVPEKTLSVDCFRFLTHEMSVDAVVRKCGRPDEEIGSGIYIFVYHLRDGSTVGVGTPYLDRLYYVNYTDARGRQFSLLKEK